jgi:hypothetical protein
LLGLARFSDYHPAAVWRDQAAISVNDCACRCQSSKSGVATSALEISVCVSAIATSRSGSANGSRPEQHVADDAEDCCVSANAEHSVMTAINVKPGLFSSIRAP